MQNKLELLLRVPEVATAVAWYRRVFAGNPAAETWIDVGEVIRLVVIHQSAPDDGRIYDRGRTPRLELVVDDVEGWINRMLGGGATLLFCQQSYAHVIDPFGHLWALRAADGLR